MSPTGGASLVAVGLDSPRPPNGPQKRACAGVGGAVPRATDRCSSVPVTALPPEARPIVAIHQPNFFPWLGYFHKMRWADTFVLLDDVQIQRRSGGTVTNRTELVSNGKRVVFTAPIDRTKGGAPRIDEVRFSATENFRERLARLIAHSYAKAPFMAELGNEILALVHHPSDALAVYNSAAIRRIATLLELPAKVVTSSELAVSTTSTERLADVVEKLEGRTYLAGGGAKGYQDDTIFFRRGMNVLYREFAPPVYPHGRDEPMSGLSILDALLFVGLKGTRELLEQPLDPALLRRADTMPALGQPSEGH